MNRSKLSIGMDAVSIFVTGMLFFYFIKIIVLSSLSVEFKFLVTVMFMTYLTVTFNRLEAGNHE